MTIWLLAFVLLAGLAAAGYRQGAVRVAISLAGLITGALLAIPLAPLIRKALPSVGVVHPILLWALGPFIAFVLIQIIFKSVGLFVHKKVEMYYKYKAGDLRHSLWERLNRRTGACLGLLNATVYLVLISLVIYPISYLTCQMANKDGDSKMVRLVNRMGTELGSTGLVKAIVAIDPVPDMFYDVADVAGLIYQDVRVLGRLGRYPLFLRLEEQPLYKPMFDDASYRKMFVGHQPWGLILIHTYTASVFNNPEELRKLWGLVVPNIKDLRSYLETGKSAQYDSETILGRWSFDSHTAELVLKRNNPDLTSRQMQRAKAQLYPVLDQAKMVAYPDKKVSIKGFVTFNWAAAKIPPGTVIPVRPAGAQPSVMQPAPPRGGGGGRAGGGGRGRGLTATGLTSRITQPAAEPPPVAAAPTAPGAVAPNPAASLVSAPQDLEGRWERAGSNYRLIFGGRAYEGTMEGDRITMTGDVTPLTFERD